MSFLHRGGSQTGYLSIRPGEGTLLPFATSSDFNCPTLNPLPLSKSLSKLPPMNLNVLCNPAVDVMWTANVKWSGV
ncbi:hypothetical protein TNCV_2580501 [Trichonephila clavipes]|uniref:Uncharacterized protein n=1 Tax=Trichonephila clavipes TaxID=2585209 RepID=A0A8X6VHI3_TRICX|nr:hypothetical protein TNCV_2580501 [Trichonephila clavipes]